MGKPTDALENHPTQTLASGAELKTDAVAICGDNATLLAEFVGCGQPIGTIEELYRCTHCSVPFHRDCAEHHFKDSTVLTLQMVEEIEREARATQEPTA